MTLEKMSDYGKRNIPFIFILDFDLQQPIVLPLTDAAKAGIFFDIKEKSNYQQQTSFPQKIELEKSPITFEKYAKAIEMVQRNINYGDSFLTNLTFPTPININLSLRQIFEHSHAPYRLLFKDQFTVFSPESFIQIQNDQIASFPMKGTIDARLPFAKERLLADKKERAEHFTIVDLIRNDLSQVAKKVRVERFRYIENIRTAKGELLQASSKIVGELPTDWAANLGTIFAQLLPAGSISGAPKKRTIEIIKEAEQYERAYYTGVFGYYENGKVESGVMIRFIEKQKDQLVFKSGGGITTFSHPQKEYQELIAKIYVPIYREYSTVERQNAAVALAHQTL